ncbi:MAG: CBS domain-containing protein [Methylococcaceae bacterium]
MKKNEPVSKIMTTQVITVQTGQPLSQVRKVMTDSLVHHVPVVEGKKLVGLISFTDLMKINCVINGADERSIDAIIDQQFSITDVMTTELVTIKPGHTIREAAQMLAKGAFHSLPVVDAAGDIAGMVTSTDLLNYLIEQY